MRRMVAVGSWMLAKLGRGPYAEAVAGDLAEGVARGRSASWYWGQVMMAMIAAWRRGLETRAGRVLFVVGCAAITRTQLWQHFVVEPIFWPVSRWAIHYEVERQISGIAGTRVSWLNLLSPIIFLGMILPAMFLTYRVLRGRTGRHVPALRMVGGMLAGLGLWTGIQCALLGIEMTALFSRLASVRMSLRFVLFHPALGGHAAVEWLWRPLLMAASLYFMIAWTLPVEKRGDEMRNGAAA